jgi:type II secretory pathway component PulJ
MQHPMQVKEIQGFTLGAVLLALVLLVYRLRKKAA